MLDAAVKEALDTLRSRVSSARGQAALKTVEEEIAQGNKASGKPRFPSKENVREYADQNGAKGRQQPPLASMASKAKG